MVLAYYKKEGQSKPRSLNTKIIPPLPAMISDETPANPLLKDYYEFKKNGYWRKLCLNCKNRETVVNGGVKVDFFFRCKYLDTTILSVHLTWEKVASKCAGWVWIGAR